MNQHENKPGDGNRNQQSTTGLDETAERETSRIIENIAQTRADMGGTLEEIHGKLNPTVLKEQAVSEFHDAREKITAEMLEAKESLKAEIKAELAHAKQAMREKTVGRVETMVKDTRQVVKQTGTSLVDTVKENPIPAAMVGVGAAWLLLRARSTARRGMTGELQEPGYDLGRYRATDVYGEQPPYSQGRELVEEQLYAGEGEAGESIGGALAERGEQVSEQARAKADEVRRKVGSARRQAGQLAQRARESIQRAGGAAGARVGSARQAVQDRSRQVGQRVEHAFEENPLVLGAAALGAGVLIGAALPISRRENQWMGRARDTLVERTQSAASDALGRVQEAAQRVQSSARGDGE